MGRYRNGSLRYWPTWAEDAPPDDRTVAEGERSCSQEANVAPYSSAPEVRNQACDRRAAPGRGVGGAGGITIPGQVTGEKMQLLPEADCVFQPMRAGLKQCMMKPYVTHPYPGV